MPALGPGARIGPYEIVAAIGAGGMGEVYRARDVKLGRDVALKVLPELLVSDPERLARLHREAQVLASLNHPHIAQIYGLEDSGDTHALVLELVEGETLADRIARGPLAVDEALRIAIQIADALQTAHDQGIIHRDLKPANVKITPGDQVKVLDFGLAKLNDTNVPNGPNDPNDPNVRGALSLSPTLSIMATQAGVILGTAAYMSPEQAKGFPADQRSDVFAFGCVLYEMLTGRQLFQGDTAAEVMASVLVREPDLSALPTNLNPRLPEALRRCLDKNPRRRWQAIGDLRTELEAIASAPRVIAAAALGATRPLWKRAVPVVVTALVVGMLASAATWYFRPSTGSTVTRFSFALGPGQQFTNNGRRMVAISPDGTQMVYVANSRLYLRSMSDLEARPISGTSFGGGVLNPVFSPDSASIAFWAASDQTIKRIAIGGGSAITISQASRPNGVTWDGNWLLVGQGRAGIMRVTATGGKPETIITVKDGETADGPRLLPDGRTVLFSVTTAGGVDRWDKAQIVAQAMGSAERKIVVEAGSDGRYLPTGHLVYAIAGTLFAVPFDLNRLEVASGAVPVIEGIKRAGNPEINTGVAQFAVSDGGSLMFVPGPASTTFVPRDLVRLDRKGNAEALKVPQGSYDYPRVSPDGRRLAFESDDGREATVWIYDLDGASSMRRLTFGGRNRFPIWSSDSQRVAFQSNREGDLGIFWQRADGTGTAQRLTKAAQGTSHYPESWAPDGRSVLFSATRNEIGASLWVLSLPDGRTVAFDDVQNPRGYAGLIRAALSPDGRWVAYVHAPTVADYGLYVQPFPATGAKYQISDAGSAPRWSPDGRELFYTVNGNQLVSVQVTTQPTFSFGNPVPVPGSERLNLPAGLTAERRFDIAPDGSIIGIVDAEQDSAGTAIAPQISVVLNWFDELKRRVPTR